METTPIEAAGTTEAAGRFSRRRHVALGSFWFGNNFVTTPVYTILLQLQVAEVIARDRQGLAIGVATGVGGVFAMALPPLVGALSDHLHTPWGRRRPIMVAGVLGVILALVVMWSSHSYPPLLVGFVMVVAFINVAAGAYAGVIPDLIHGREIGLASGLLGLFLQLGSVASLLVTLVMSSTGHIRMTYGVIIVVAILSLLPTLWAASGERERSVPERPHVGLRDFLRPLWSGDFGWAFFTRFLNASAFYAVLPFLLLAFRDLFGIASPASVTSLFELVVTVVAVPCAVIGGLLSDRHGRKRFVYAAGGLQALVLLVFLGGSAIPLTAVMALGAAYGIGYGLYSSVDWALGIDTLPDRERPAKDLGLYHVADALPRVLLPLLVGGALDAVNATSPNAGYRSLFLFAAALYGGGALLVTRIRSVR
ncbi:MAG TPA: MFS transporter [Candidatus Eisenbacteria bacterium]|nr:MFS transporter [Candidatus Eisenbacteria bacterium]